VTLARRVLVLSRRPAHVVGETAVPLDRQARSDRLGRAAVAARDRVLSLLEKGDAHDPGQLV
jgi:ABC-type nitrate/sulfonate/bicarbonate transport system ATPase subunit